MRAVRLHGIGDLRVEDVADPGEPAAGEVRIRVAAAGICGSDLHNFRTGQWLSRVPSTAGHEIAGTVTAVGPGVERHSVGDRVVADSRVWCGVCARCGEGLRHLCEKLGFVGEVCDGGFAEALLLPARLVHRLPEGVDDAVAATAEPLAVALHTVGRLAPPSDAPVLVVGCGPIGGLAALALARRHGAGPVLVADRNRARAALVADVAGATVVELDATAIAAATGDRPLRHTIEATGSVEALGRLVEIVATGARVALVGIYHGRLDLDPTALVEREVSLVGCHAFNDEMPEAIAMMPVLGPAIAALIDREIGLDEVPAAYARLIAGEASRLKTIVRP